MVVPTGGRILTKKSEAGGEGLALGLGLRSGVAEKQSSMVGEAATI